MINQPTPRVYVSQSILISGLILLPIMLTMPTLSLVVVLQEEGPPHFQGLRVGSCLTLGNESSKETHMLTKQETLLGRGAQAQSSRVREPRRTALPRGSQSQGLC